MTITLQDLVEELSRFSTQHPVAGSAIVAILVIVLALRPLALEVARMRTCRALMLACPPGTLLTRTCGRDRILVVAAPPARPLVVIGPRTIIGAYLSRHQAAS